MGQEIFDRDALNIESLSKRRHDLDISVIRDPDDSVSSDRPGFEAVRAVAVAVVEAKKAGAAIIMMMGAHVIRAGVQKYLIDLMKRGYISCVAMNGACIIHDFEFALVGATTESVPHYIREGQFGLWRETGLINEIINRAYREESGIGMGEAIGRAIEGGEFPNRDISLLAAGYRLDVPMTVHVGIGYDIIHELPNCDGAATGALSYHDFLRFASVVENLQRGVVMNFGSAVMAPEVFLKALSMARNVAHQKGRVIRDFVTLVADLRPLPENTAEEPSKDDASYYFRPFKTMLVRTVADGGKGYYVRGGHGDTIPCLWDAVNKEEKRSGGA